MKTEPSLSRMSKTLIVLVLVVTMYLLYTSRNMLDMSVFVLLITLGIIALGLIIKSLITDDDER